jgi:spermidine synthase
VPVLNGLAWLLATQDELSDGNGVEATAHAERAAELNGRRHPKMLDTLAAAYAAAGMFSDAIATGEDRPSRRQSKFR